MKKGKKRDVLGGPASNRGTENPRGVVASAKVGKGQPPEAFKWKPGQSGNPSGKASEAREVTVGVITAALAKVDQKLGKSNLERIIEHSIRLALQGSFKDKKLLLAYGLGQPAQSIDMNTTVNYADVLSRVRAARERAELAAPAPTNGRSDPATAQAAAATPDQDLSTAREDAEQPAKPKIRVEPWAN